MNDNSMSKIVRLEYLEYLKMPYPTATTIVLGYIIELARLFRRSILTLPR